MNDLNQRYLIAGSSALKPDCSRHSNENEHIINFPANAITTYGNARRPSVKHRKTLKQQTLYTLNNTTMVRDLRKGSLKGNPFGPASKGSLVAAGMVYTFIALAALYFGA